MNQNFLLQTPLSQELYHICAKDLPLIDFHNHLSVADLANDRRFENITALWVASDPYKHRAMRMCGVPEKYITGDASDFEKFAAWCRVYPRLVGTPLYHWTQMELSRVFGIEELPSENNAKELWDKINALLKLPEFSTNSILAKFNVEYSAPCAALLDDLSIFEGTKNTAPSLRGDDVVAPSKAFLEKLADITKVSVKDMESLKAALSKRLDVFHAMGTRFSDHALDNGFSYLPDDGKNDARLQAILDGNALTEADTIALRSAILVLLGNLYAARGWTMQLHIGAQRFTSSRLRSLAGAAGGFASIGSPTEISSLTSLLDDVEKTDAGLPRVILFPLNPADNAAMAVLSGSYSKDGISGLVQQGPAWWWCDHLTGMYEVFESVSAYSVLSNFVGMTTDSRSILSFVRHDYFRRALCNWIGNKAEAGVFPKDVKALAPMVKAMCYGNAKERLG
ncbi:MAG: glucuronate isomerase [Ruminococcaceae bacterium]|nr:glucuronate isomerase [Oscillospiraceae bacterium]